MFMIIVLFIVYQHIPTITGHVVALDKINFHQNIDVVDFAFVNFYADWCHFSQMLMPIYTEASMLFENRSNVLFGKANCDSAGDLCKEFNINKFPTLKYFRHGAIAKKEYRGARSIKSLRDFVESNILPIFIPIVSTAEIDSKVEIDRRNILVFLNSDLSEEMNNLKEIAPTLRDDCNFYLGVGQNFIEYLKDGDTIVYRPPKGAVQDKARLSGNLLRDAEYLKNWLTEKCVPFVRELTFENAEGFTEEGLPFMILFHKPDDKETLQLYKEQVALQLKDHHSFINALHADGIKFAHPLTHLKKSAKDLPLLAIDSFTHMYMFSDIKRLSEPNALLQFLLDLYSGKLHREFHYGPDTAPVVQTTLPPESIFKKLKPSSTRYTLKDEL